MCLFFFFECVCPKNSEFLVIVVGKRGALNSGGMRILRMENEKIKATERGGRKQGGGGVAG